MQAVARARSVRKVTEKRGVAVTLSGDADASADTEAMRASSASAWPALASARLGAALRVAAAHGREAQVALLAGVTTACYIVTQPPTQLWRALTGLDFLAGVALLAAAQLAALPPKPATKDAAVMRPGEARAARDIVHRSALLDATACVAAPWAFLALGLADSKSSAAFCAPQVWYVLMAAAARASAEFTSPGGAARTAGAVAAAFDALRLVALWRLASPAAGGTALLQLAAVGATCYAFAVVRLGAELPAMAAARSGKTKEETKKAKPTTPPPPREQPKPAAMTPPAATDSISPRSRESEEDATSEARSSRDDDEKEWAMPPRQHADDDVAAADAALRVAKEALRSVNAGESGGDATSATKKRAT
jgi:hypothetical protein